MLTAQGLADELHRLVERGLAAQLDPAEIADALQNEMEFLREGRLVRAASPSAPVGEP